MLKKVKEIFQIISAILILSAGFALTFRFLDGRLLIGLVLIGVGIALLVREVIKNA
ncbi:MAG: hypothetical protein ACYDIA_13785 [Candidatus Humimicrobiaceae bacterium]